jgi:uncharacterized C2H2 Zn-finger protein
MNVNSENIYKCLICNKIYASQSSLCHHNKKFHKNKSDEDVVIVIQNNNDKPIIKNLLKCEYCNKIFATRQSKSKHKIKVCNKNLNNNSKDELHLEELEKKNIELEKKNEEIKKSLKEIKELLVNAKQPIYILNNNKPNNKINILGASNNLTVSNSSNMFINYTKNIFTFTPLHI